MPSPWQLLTLLFTPSFYILLSCGCLAQFRIIFNTLSTAAYHMQRGPLEAFAPSKHTAGAVPRLEQRRHNNMASACFLSLCSPQDLCAVPGVNIRVSGWCCITAVLTFSGAVTIWRPACRPCLRPSLCCCAVRTGRRTNLYPILRMSCW